ncbi:LysR family transcriptional regulator [Roseovarius atlanticus]|uniref:LysR family transcriptional regulator n=1 Tax=Roseovarius atlanticus TaxID=1641875 RepID=UPI001C93CB35|nr:LysR family transcriptional regulator [Roseovarius atlanticus]MBY5989115.1 LysR family transcriptional regulator [Roseovarius atlanticus]MBY6124507.1 LysR family transcriptional regulator [Roseovarius atlanticus]MBY6149002.1 LysR family transcriptional regulator [Roseovarius atlanticus]
MNLNSIDLNLLKVFAALYETHKQTLAAQHVGLSQPALSHALKRLREAFGDELFLRKDGAYQPTQKAMELAPPVLAALRLLETTLSEPERFRPQDATGTFSISVSDYSSTTLLPRLCAEVAHRAPGIRLVVSQLSYLGFEDGLKSGEIDLAITSQPADAPMIEDERILREAAVFIARENHPLKDRLSTLEGFTSADHLIVNLFGKPTSWLDDRLSEMGLHRKVKMVVPYFNAVPQIVTGTDMIGGLPRRLAEVAVQDFPVEMYDLPLDFQPIDFFMCWNARRQRDPELRWFRKLLSDICRGV